MSKKLSELYKPKTEIGKAFVDANKPQQPVMKKFKPAENDGQFSATNVKTFKRSVHRMGYDVGADEVENKGGTPVDVAPKEKGIAPYTIVLAKESIMETFNFEADEPLTEDEVIDTLFEMLEAMLNETSGRDFARGVNPNHPASTHKDAPNRHGYNPESVNKAIDSSNRAGRKIGKKEAKAIHALLKGRH